MLRPLSEAGLEVTPRKIGEKEIEFLLDHYKHLDTDTQKWMFNILNGWLKFKKNFVYEEMMVSWPSETRTNIDWLSPEEALAMLETAQGVERIVIHLEVRLWFRRCEVQRVLTKDVSELKDPVSGQDYLLEGMISVRGKGRGGGKWRTVAWAPDTREEVAYYNMLRAEMVERARQYHSTSWRTGKRARPKEPFVEPEEWVINQKGRTARGYSESGIDNMVTGVAKRAGIQRRIGNHTLRRTGARLAYYAGVPIAVIMETLGHTSEKQTMRYLGLTVNEGAKGQQKVYDYLQGVKKKIDPRRAGKLMVVGQEVPMSKRGPSS